MDSIRNCCHRAYTYPVSREKLMVIGGGVLCALLVVTVLVAVCSGGDDHVAVKINGSDVLKDVPLIVGHNDLAQNLKAILKNQINSFDFHNVSNNTEEWKKCSECKTDLTRLKNGMVGTQVWTVTSSCNSSFKDSVSLVLEQIDVIQRLISANSKNVSLVVDSLGIKKSFSEKISSLIAVEGGHTIDGRLAVLRTYYSLGVRSLSLGNDCGGNQTIPWYNTTTLFDFGLKIVKEMNRLGMVIDIAKLPDAVQKIVLDTSEAPVIVGNANAFSIYNQTGNIKDDVLTKLKEKKGLIMVSFNPDLIVAKDKSANSTQENKVMMDNLITHINYIRNKTGPEFIGIGGGYDGDDFQLGDPSKFPVLFDALYEGNNSQTKWTLDELKGLAGNNFLRVLDAVEKKAEEFHGNNTHPFEVYEAKEDLVNRTTCYSDFDNRY